MCGISQILSDQSNGGKAARQKATYDFGTILPRDNSAFESLSCREVRGEKDLNIYTYEHTSMNTHIHFIHFLYKGMLTCF